MYSKLRLKPFKQKQLDLSNKLKKFTNINKTNIIKNFSNNTYYNYSQKNKNQLFNAIPNNINNNKLMLKSKKYAQIFYNYK